MPTIIDHDQRRRDVADVAARIIARSGMDGLTVRELAAQSAFSTVVVRHYFKNKRQMLLFTFRHVADRQYGVERPPEGWTAPAVRKHLRSALPLSAAQRENWRVWFAFWGVAASDRVFAREQAKHMEIARSGIRGRVQEAYGLSEPDAADLAQRLLTVMMGLAMDICFAQKGAFTRRALDKLVDDMLDMTLPPEPGGTAAAARSRAAGLATPLRPASPARRDKVTDTQQPTRLRSGQPVEAPHLEPRPPRKGRAR